MIASKKAESVAKELAMNNQWGCSGLMLRASRELHTRSNISEAKKYVELSVGSAMGPAMKSSTLDVLKMIEELEISLEHP